MHDRPQPPARQTTEPLTFDPELLEVDDPSKDVLARVRAGLRSTDPAHSDESSG